MPYVPIKTSVATKEINAITKPLRKSQPDLPSLSEYYDMPDEIKFKLAQTKEEKALLAAEELLARKKARSSLYEFIKYVWWRSEPFVDGVHIRDICAHLDAAITKFLNGESSYLDVAVCYGHSKSTICSIALPAYFLGRCYEKLDASIIMSGYGTSLLEGFSKNVKLIINSTKYKRIFPNVKIVHGNNSAKEWGINDSAGRVSAVSLGGQITGKRAHLVIIDDYCKNAEESRSKTYSDKVWQSFRADIMSRLMPTHIVIVVATPWSVMGLQSRIIEAEKNDINFPKFTHIKYPARRYEEGKFIGYLWPGLYTNAWYEAQYSINKGHFATALLDCNPMPESGNRFDTSQIKEHDLSEFPEGRYKRAWDLASSSKERNSEDPDYTVGVLGYITKIGKSFTKVGISEEVHFWIKDLILLREEAPKRNAIIIEAAIKDSPRTPILVEDYGAYKDSYTTLKHLLTGYNVVGQHLHKEKSAKAAGLEPIFAHGRVHIPKGAPWKDEFIRQFMTFPEGHDDIVDACSIIYNDTMHQQSSILVMK